MRVFPGEHRVCIVLAPTGCVWLFKPLDFYPLFELANCARCLLEDTEMQERGIKKAKLGSRIPPLPDILFVLMTSFPNDTCYGPLAEHVCLPHLFIVTI